MVCPKCSVQCQQYMGIGEGSADNDYYDTAEIKECPKCKSKYIEYYVTFEVNSLLPEHIRRVGETIKNLLKIVKNT